MTGHARPKVKPELEITSAQAQAIVDRIEEKQTVAQVFALHGGEIGAVHEIRLAGRAPSFVLKVYPETLHWKMRKEVFVSAASAGTERAGAAHHPCGRDEDPPRPQLRSHGTSSTATFWAASNRCSRRMTC